jgi:hypothetical protein
LSRISLKTGSLLETQDRSVSATKRATGRRITKAHTTKGQAHGVLNMTTVLDFVKGTVVSKRSRSPFATHLYHASQACPGIDRKALLIADGCSDSMKIYVLRNLRSLDIRADIEDIYEHHAPRPLLSELANTALQPWTLL